MLSLCYPGKVSAQSLCFAPRSRAADVEGANEGSRQTERIRRIEPRKVGTNKGIVSHLDVLRATVPSVLETSASSFRTKHIRHLRRIRTDKRRSLLAALTDSTIRTWPKKNVNALPKQSSSCPIWS